MRLPQTQNLDQLLHSRRLWVLLKEETKVGTISACLVAHCQRTTFSDHCLVFRSQSWSSLVNAILNVSRIFCHPKSSGPLRRWWMNLKMGLVQVRPLN